MTRLNLSALAACSLALAAAALALAADDLAAALAAETV